MKNLNLIPVAKTLTILSVLFTLTAVAQPDIVGSLGPSMSAAQIRDLGQQPAESQQNRDRRTLWGVSQEIPTIPNGIPGMVTEEERTPLFQRLSTAELIRESIQEAASLGWGDRIRYFHDQADLITRKACTNILEESVCETLNRAKDIAGFVVIAGNNAELVQSLLVNFYYDNFVLALSYANNPCLIDYSRSTAPTREFTRTQEAPRATLIVNPADFGFTYSVLLNRHSQTLTSPGYQAALLIKMIDYIGLDFNQDNRRTTDSFTAVIFGACKITGCDGAANPIYRRILTALHNHEEPTQSDVNQLRAKIDQIWSTLPDRLRSSVPR